MEVTVKTKCALCKCLNLVIEGKKHPSQTIWLALTRKFKFIGARDQKHIESFCLAHRVPSRRMNDYQSVKAFIADVLDAVLRLI